MKSSQLLSTVALVVALAAGVWVAIDQDRTKTADMPGPARGGSGPQDLADLAAEVEAQRRDWESTRGEVQILADRVRDLTVAVEKLGRGAAGAPGPGATGAAPGGRGSAPGTPPGLTSAEEAEQLYRFASLHGRVMSGKATEEETTAFWELARNHGMAERLIADFEKIVAENPADNDARMNLAEAYITKLLSIPGGPEQGVWGGKAESQWKQVLDQDADHWDARFSLAFGYSMYPDFMNKVPDAITEFVELRRRQERLPVDAKQAQTYLHLSSLYRRQGNFDEARAVLSAGLQRHGADPDLQKALDALSQ